MEQKVILLADDDRDDTEMFCEALAEIDDTVICHSAINGNELLKKLNALSLRPQLIFLDLNMQVMNGWDCLRLLKQDERYQNIPVIMISTSSHIKEMDTAMSLGAICYFIKPNTFKELKDVLRVITSNLQGALNDAIIKLQANGQAIFYLPEISDFHSPNYKYP